MLEYFASLGQTLPTILGALGGILLGNHLALSRERTLQKEANRKAAQYLAVRVVCALDPFIRGCVAVVGDTGIPGKDDEYSPEVGQPILVLPTDIEWSSIDAVLAYRILSLLNEIDVANEAISFASVISTPPNHDEYFETRALVFARIGLSALDAAEQLRRAYSLPDRPTHAGESPRELFVDTIAVTEAEVARRNRLDEEALRKLVQLAATTRDLAEHSPPLGQKGTEATCPRGQSRINEKARHP